MQTNLYNSEAEQIQAQTKGRTRNCFPATTNSSLLVNALACYKAASCIINEKGSNHTEGVKKLDNKPAPRPIHSCIGVYTFFFVFWISTSVYYIHSGPHYIGPTLKRFFPPFLSLKYHDLDSIQVLKTQKDCKILLGRFHCSLFFHLNQCFSRNLLQLFAHLIGPNWITSLPKSNWT